MTLQSMQSSPRSDGLLEQRSSLPLKCPFGHSRRHPRYCRAKQVLIAAASPQSKQADISIANRRQAVQLAVLGLIAGQSVPALASERRGVSRYIKKKSLDPLETYVPAVIQARDELVDAGKLMEQDPIEARIRLRSNAFEGLRDNIRALGEYATTNNAASERAAKDLVNRTFLTIQEFDFQLFSANRNKEPVGKEAATKLQQAVSAMDNLLATVPADNMSKAREVLQAIEARALARSNGDAVAAFDEQRLERLVPDAS